MEKLLWNSKLDSDFHERYWTLITDKYAKADCAVRIILALAASSTVATWSIWESYAIIWKTFSAISAVIAVAAPIFECNRKAASAAKLAAKWTDLRIAYADLWNAYLQTGTNDKLENKYRQLNGQSAALQKSEPELQIALDEKRLSKAQKAVLTSHGYPTEKGSIKKIQRRQYEEQAR